MNGGITREETDLTLNEQGIDAVGSWLKKAIAKGGQDDEPPHPTDTWEPPIDNEV